MEIQRKDWDSYVSKLAAINRKAADLMTAWIDTNGMDDMGALAEYAVAISAKYGDAAAALACEMYDSIVDAYGVIAQAAEPAKLADAAYTKKAVETAAKKAPTTVPNAVARLVKMASSDTMLHNADRDGAEFAWVPNGDTCAYCISKAAAGWKKKPKNDLRGGHAEHIHANCDCEYAVRFGGKGGVGGFYPERYKEIYYGAGTNANQRINAIRREQYAENRGKIREQQNAAYAARKERESLENDKNVDLSTQK